MAVLQAFVRQEQEQQIENVRFVIDWKYLKDRRAARAAELLARDPYHFLQDRDRIRIGTQIPWGVVLETAYQEIVVRRDKYMAYSPIMADIAFCGGIPIMTIGVAIRRYIDNRG